jgi:hypothetical protein
MAVAIRNKRCKRNILCLALALGLGVAGLASAQSNAAGAIHGHAAQGDVVVIENAATGYRREITVGADGGFRAPQTPSGTYTVTLRRADGSTRVRERVGVSVGTGTQVDFRTDETATLDTITVTASNINPVDVSSVESATILSAQQIASIPVARDATSVALLAPGTVRGDAAFGNLASFGGSSVAENAYYVNGFNITNSFNNLAFAQIPFEAIAEQQVKTGGYGAEFGRSTGGVVNLITRRGTNEFSAGGALYWTPSSLAGKTPDIRLNNGDLLQDNSRDDAEQSSVALWAGGPLIRDRLFAYGLVQFARNHADTWNDVNAGINANTRTRSPTWLLKMDWNLSQDHLLELTSFSDVARGTQTVHTNDEGVLNRTGVLGTVHTEQGGTSHSLKYTGYLSDTFTLSALLGRGTFSRSIYGISANGTRQEWSGDIDAPDTGCPVIVDQRNSTLLGATPAIHGCDFIGGTLGRPDAGDTRKQFRLDAEWQLGDHQLRFGYDADRFTSIAGGAIEGGQVWNYATIDPDGVPLNDDDLDFVVNVVFKNGATVDVDQRAFYIEDSWQVTPTFLAYAGLRWDSFDNRNGNGESYASIDNQLGPRLGFAWDVKGDSSLKVFGNAGRYALPLTATVAIRGASASIFSQQLFFYDSVDPATGAPVGATPFTPVTYLNNEFGANKDPRTIASENLQPMYQDEYILGFQKQVNDHWSFGLRTVYRDLRRAIDDNCDERAIYDWAIDNGFVDPDGDPFQSPADSTVPKEIAFINPGFTFCHLYNPGSEGVFNIDIDGNGVLEKVTIDADTLGPKAKRTYSAAEFFFEGHWEKLFLQGSYTWARSNGNTEGGIKSDIGQADTGTTQDFDYRELMLGADGPLPNDRKHTLKVFGNYELNDQWSIGGNLLVQSGRPINCFGVYGNDPVHYGASYFSCSNTPGTDADGDGVLDNGIQVVPRGSAGRTPWQRQLDLNLAWKPAFADGRLTFKLDVFNVFNSRTVSSVVETAETGQGSSLYDTVYKIPTGFQAPRTVRVMLQYAF